MSYFAKVINGIVDHVIVADQDFIDLLPDSKDWIETSYSTRENISVDFEGKPDGGVALRGNFAGIGYIYDAANDVFYPQKPHPSATLDTKTWSWTGIPVTTLASE